jgi:hypothetical protein
MRCSLIPADLPELTPFLTPSDSMKTWH